MAPSINQYIFENFDLGITSEPFKNDLKKCIFKPILSFFKPIQFGVKTILFSLQFCRSLPPPPGLGFGLIYLPAIVSVTCYFEKKRSFATGIAVCGSGLGTFVFSPLVELLVSTVMRCGRSLLLYCLSKFNRSSFRLACKSCYCTLLTNSIDLLSDWLATVVTVLS